jgi:hypothetical protein
MDIGKLQPRSSVIPRRRKFHAPNRTWVSGRIVDNGEVIEEAILRKLSVASVEFDGRCGLIPNTVEDAAETLCSRNVRTAWRVKSRRPCFSDD